MVPTIYIPLIFLQISCLLINGQLFSPEHISVITETKVIAVVPPISPCPNVFHYLYTQNTFIGVLTITPPGDGRLEPINVRVELSVAASLPTSYVGNIRMVDNDQVAVKKVMNILPISYHIRFPIISPVPRVTKVYLNGHLICSGAADPLVSGGTVTTINLNHSFTPYQFFVETGPSARLPPMQPTIQTKPVVQPTNQQIFPVVQPTPGTIGKFPIFLPESQGDCGRVYLANTLILGGSAPIQRNDYPWAVALFHRVGNREYYFCQGSLLSKHYVLTAAHCMTPEKKKLQLEDLILYLGKYDIQNMREDGAQRLEAKSIFIHSEFSAHTLIGDTDIAIIETSTPANLDHFVQPVCLWPKRSPNIDILYGKIGKIAGWGVVDRSLLPSPTLMEAYLPVVRPDECRRLSPISYDSQPHQRTFCAGSRNGTLPCKGDSGGGLVFKDTVGDPPRWYIRGVLSQTLLINEKNICSTDNYAIFADVAMQSEWISQYIKY